MGLDDEYPSLGDTTTDPFDFVGPARVQPGEGCLLQIYPATSNSQMIRLTEERTLIGREPSCEIVIEDEAMSRVHAAFELTAAGYFLCDLGSTNGTRVDDRQLRGRIPLVGGELIRMGGSVLKFMASGNTEANYHAVVHELMTRDSLTHCYNRSYVLPAIDRELETCRLHRQTLAVLLLDIDHFKVINDTHGHLVGDEVLRIFCERVRSKLRRVDILARFGGEEFVVCLLRTTQETAAKRAEEIRDAIGGSPFSTSMGLVDVTCSLGVASSDGVDLSTSDTLLSLADRLLYQSKDNGRNMVSCASAAELKG